MKRIVSIIRSLDKLSNGKQIGIVFCILLIDALTVQLLWPWVSWIFGSHPEAMWGIVSPHEGYAADWFFHFFYWAVTLGLFSLWALPDNKQMSFYRWFALWLIVWVPQKLFGMFILGYALTIIFFNDGCPTYQFENDDHYSAECTDRGIGVRP